MCVCVCVHVCVRVRVRACACASMRACVHAQHVLFSTAAGHWQCVCCFPSCRLTDILAGKTNFQLQYQVGFCLWMLSFESDIVEKMRE